MSWGNYYGDPSEFEYDSFTSLNQMSDQLVYDEKSDGLCLYYGEITTPPTFYEVPKPTPATENRRAGNNPTGNTGSERRLSGNNPYGSRGCASCVPCRKRKGRVLRIGWRR